jgi:Protein of unknown function (DUF2752)
MAANVPAGLPAEVDTRGRWQRVKGPTLFLGALMGASVLLHVRDPHRSGSWGYCPWLALTGTYCPGCGGLRAVNDLTNGDIRAAASSNLLFVGSLPLVAGLYLRWLAASWNGVNQQVSSKRAVVYASMFLALVTVFWVVRNLSFGAWLAP